MWTQFWLWKSPVSHEWWIFTLSVNRRWCRFTNASTLWHCWVGVCCVRVFVCSGAESADDITKQTNYFQSFLLISIFHQRIIPFFFSSFSLFCSISDARKLFNWCRLHADDNIVGRSSWDSVRRCADCGNRRYIIAARRHEFDGTKSQ